MNANPAIALILLRILYCLSGKQTALIYTALLYSRASSYITDHINMYQALFGPARCKVMQLSVVVSGWISCNHTSESLISTLRCSSIKIYDNWPYTIARFATCFGPRLKHPVARPSGCFCYFVCRYSVISVPDWSPCPAHSIPSSF